MPEGISIYFQDSEKIAVWALGKSIWVGIPEQGATTKKAATSLPSRIFCLGSSQTQLQKMS